MHPSEETSVLALVAPHRLCFSQLLFQQPGSNYVTGHLSAVWQNPMRGCFAPRLSSRSDSHTCCTSGPDDPCPFHFFRSSNIPLAIAPCLQGYLTRTMEEIVVHRFVYTYLADVGH